VSALTFCSGSSVTFSLLNTDPGNTYLLYKGDEPVLTLTGTGSPETFTFTGAFTGAGTYTVRVEAKTESGSCEANMTGSYIIVENPLPDAPTGASNDSRCGSGTVTFSATVPDGAEIDWYASATGGSPLHTGNSYTPSISSNTIFYAEARNVTTGCTSATRTLVSGTVIPKTTAGEITGACGCVDGLINCDGTCTNPMIGTIDFAVTPTPVEAGQPITLTANATGLTTPPASAVTYSWSAPGFTPQAHVGATFNPTAPTTSGDYNVTLTVSSTGYCALTETKIITVTPACTQPVVQTLIASSSAFCTGSSVTFALSSTEAGVSYRVYKDGTPVLFRLTGTGGAATFSSNSFPGAGVYTAKVEALDGYCETAMSGSHPIVAISTPVAQTLTVSATAFCAGSTVTFALSNTEPGVQYQLYRNGTPALTLTGTGGAATFTGTFAGAGTYTAKAQPGSTCERGMSGTHTITEIAPATPVLTASAGTTACQEDGPLRFWVTNPLTTNATYTWTASPGGTQNGSSWTFDTSAGLKTATVYVQQSSSGITCRSAESTMLSRTVTATGTGTYTKQDGDCTAACSGVSYIQQYNACGRVINSRYGTRSDSDCSGYYRQDPWRCSSCGKESRQETHTCTGQTQNYEWRYDYGCSNGCGSTVQMSGTIGDCNTYTKLTHDTIITSGTCATGCASYGFKYYGYNMSGCPGLCICGN
jgi:hypothetical protein